MSEQRQPISTRRARHVPRPFSSRNPTPIGAIGLVLLLVLLVAAFNASKLPLIGGGTQYSAYFTEAANLKSGDDVMISGVEVGTVQSVTIDTRKALVKATFTVKSGFVGDESTVDIKLKTLLGAKYLEINSAGAEPQDPDETICDETPQHTCRRTTSPFDIYPAFSALTHTVDELDTDQLAAAFRTLAQDFQGTPAEVRPVVTGLSRLSATIASRDQALRTLLSQADAVTGTLAARDHDLTKLIRDGNLLLQMLNDRRAAIHSLLVNTQTLSTQLQGLVDDNQKTIGPLLDSLDDLLALLQKNQDSLDRGLALLGPFYRLFNNVVGSGRWFDNYIQNLSVCGVFGLVLNLQGSC